MQSRVWVLSLQTIVTFSLIGLLLHNVNGDELQSLIVQLRWHFIVLSVLFVLLSHLVNVARWQYLLSSQSVNFQVLLMLYGAGLFSNNFLPTGIGGDGVRITLLSRYVSLRQAIFSVGLDRLLGMLAVIGLLLPGLWYGLPPDLQVYSKFAFNSHIILLTLSCFVVALLIALIFLIKSSASRAFFARQFSNIISPAISPEVIRRPLLNLLFGAYSLSVISHIGIVAAHVIAFRALDLGVSSGAAIWLVLLGSVALMLPIAINGLGLQEGVYVTVLLAYGVPTAQSLSVALIIRALMVLFSLIGGLLSLRVMLPHARMTI